MNYFFTFLHHSQISPKYLFGIFSWLSPFFKALTELPQFEEMKTIELDATFLVLHPYVICIPHLIYHNHGIPFGLMAAPTESASLYSLLFECLKAINPEWTEDNSLYNRIRQKFYLTDEHKAFEKLAGDYSISIYHCLVHFIRSIGANSLLGLLAKQILFTSTTEKWVEKVDHYKRIFTNLLFAQINEMQNVLDRATFEKYPEDCWINTLNSHKNRFSRVKALLDFDWINDPTAHQQPFAPLFIRRVMDLPTTTNHIEATHKQLKDVVSGTHSSNLSLRLAKICQYIGERSQQDLAKIAENMPPIDLTLVSHEIETQLEFKEEHVLPPQDSVEDIAEDSVTDQETTLPQSEYEAILDIVKSTRALLASEIENYIYDLAVITSVLMFQMGMNEKIRQRPMEDFLAIFQIQLWNAILKKKDPDSLIMEQFKL